MRTFVFVFVFMAHVAPSVCGVKQHAPWSKPPVKRKNLKRPSRGLALPCSPLALDHTQSPYKKTRKGDAHSVLTPGNFNLVLQAVISPEIARQGGGWSESKQPVVETVVESVSEPPTETVTVQPDGTIQHGRKLKKKYVCCRV